MPFACRRLGLEESYGRGFDRLPAEVLDPLSRRLVGTLTAGELRRAVSAVLTALLQEASDIHEVSRVRPIVEPLIRVKSA